MKVTETRLPGVFVIEPRRFGDDRGYFMESWEAGRYGGTTGLPTTFVQDNLARSTQGVLRGLHLQHPGAQGKLVYALQGAILDVAVDVRVGSPTFGEWVGVELNDSDHRQIFVPEGFAHGYLVRSETALVAYKCTTPYLPQNEMSIRFDDPAIGVEWNVEDPSLSDKDRDAPLLAEVSEARLPQYRGDQGVAAKAA